MVRWFGVLRVFVLLLVGLSGEASQAQARGDSPSRTFAVVCKFCNNVVAESQDHRPKSINAPCPLPCGRTEPGNWKTTTDTLPGRACATCEVHLYYRSGTRKPSCRGGGLHEPTPLHQRDWR